MKDAELRELIAQFLELLDNENKDEFYGTDRMEASMVMDWFMAFLSDRGR